MRHYGTTNHTSAPGRPMGGGRGACGAWPRCRWAVVALHPLRGAAPVTWRCTRYVALHPLCGAAPVQNGCNAYGSGALPLGTSESVVGVCRGDCVAKGRTASSPLRVDWWT